MKPAIFEVAICYQNRTDDGLGVGQGNKAVSRHCTTYKLTDALENKYRRAVYVTVIERPVGDLRVARDVIDRKGLVCDKPVRKFPPRR